MLESGSADILSVERPALEALYIQAFPESSLETIQAEFTNNDAEPATAQFDEPAYLDGLRARLIEVQEITDSELQSLATARAEAVSAAMQPSGNSVSIAGIESGEAEGRSGRARARSRC